MLSINNWYFLSGCKSVGDLRVLMSNGYLRMSVEPRNIPFNGCDDTSSPFMLTRQTEVTRHIRTDGPCDSSNRGAA